jgi:tripartite-type tricarboxylate transporter receptor subunit TctC
MTHRRNLLAGLALATPALHRAGAQAWPNHELTLITGFGPGAGTDVVARALAAHMERTLGVPVVVHNRPGAAGTLGPGRVAQAKPDGYTFGLVGLSVMVVAPLTMDLPFNPWENLDILCATSELRIGMPVGPSLPNVRSLADFIEEGRRRPLTMASTNPGSAVSLFELTCLAGLQMSFVPFGSITDAAAQVAGGHVDTYTGTSEMIPLVRGGNLRLLASCSVDRWPEFPEVPTLIEQGWQTVTRQPILWAAPVGVPVEIRDRLAAALLAAARDPEVQQRQLSVSIAPRPLDRAAAINLVHEVRPGVEAALTASGLHRRGR